MKSIMIGSVAFILFFSHYHYSYVFEPGVFTLAFSYLFIYSLQRDIVKDNQLSRVIISLGGRSYAIYLIHPLIIYTGAYMLNTYYHTKLPVYIIWLPISFIIVYFLSAIYNSIIHKIQSLLNWE